MNRPDQHPEPLLRQLARASTIEFLPLRLPHLFDRRRLPALRPLGAPPAR